MRIKLLLFITIVLLTVLLSACFNQNKKPIDGKISGAISLRLEDLVGETPISVTVNEEKLILNENETKEIKTKMDALLNSLHPTQQLNNMPLKYYLTITYQLKYDQIILMLPKSKSNNPQNQIYMKSIDPSRPDEYYLLKGEKKETLVLIDWLSDKK
jgi:hypothetical protein